MKVSYYPGCTLRTQRRKSWTVTRAPCAKKLGVELCEIENWQCCGGVFVTAKDEIATQAFQPCARWSARRDAERAVGDGVFRVP